MREIFFQIARGSEGKPYLQEYHLSFQPRKTLVWWLTKIQEELDPSLTFPVSCRAGLCGGCGLVLNGKSVLACETMLDAEMENDDKAIRVEPLHNFPVVRDLLVDWTPIIAHMKRILLQGPNDGDPVNADEKCLKPEYNQALMKLGTCTTCGLCVSECPAMEGGAFIPPYIFVKGQAVADDPRVDSAIKKMLLNRLKPYAEYCLMCGKCAAVCPASLSPEAELKKLFP